MMTPEKFSALVGEFTASLVGRPLDKTLEDELNERAPASHETFKTIFEACHAGIAAGWMCNREGGGIRYGRVLKATPATHGFSVDVVDMNEVAGPHHAHPNGEIDLVMPLDGEAKFDGHRAGWVVYAPNSAHRLTVTGGRVLVLYLLPGGAIDFAAAA